MNAGGRALAAAGLLLTASCAVLPAPRLSAPLDPDTVRDRLLQDEVATRTLRGLARLAFDGPHGRGSASHVVVVALPDRARVEALTPLGTTALVVTLRATELRVHSLLQREYGVGRATRETLGRLVKVPVPPEPLLRLLAGLPPLPLRAQDPRLTLVADGAAVRVDSVDGEYWQRAWIEADGAGVARGEVGRASEVLFTFVFADRQPTDGRDFPFEIRVEEPATQSRLYVRYERVQLNLPADPDLFELPWPTDPATRIVNLGGATPPPGGISP
jgi:hypothetical protein